MGKVTMIPLDDVRHIWEARNCGSCEELGEMHDRLAAKLATLEADVLQREAQLILTAHQDPASKMSQQTIGTLQKIGGIMMTRAALARAKVGA